MKQIIAFFVSIWVFLFGKKVVEPVKVEPDTLSEKLDKLEKKYFRPSGPRTPQHNNRKSKPNQRGVRSRYVQYTPGGRAIYHEMTKKKGLV